MNRPRDRSASDGIDQDRRAGPETRRVPERQVEPRRPRRRVLDVERVRIEVRDRPQPVVSGRSVRIEWATLDERLASTAEDRRDTPPPRSLEAHEEPPPSSEIALDELLEEAGDGHPTASEPPPPPPPSAPGPASAAPVCPSVSAAPPSVSSPAKP